MNDKIQLKPIAVRQKRFSFVVYKICKFVTETTTKQHSNIQVLGSDIQIKKKAHNQEPAFGARVFLQPTHHSSRGLDKMSDQVD